MFRSMTYVVSGISVARAAAKDASKYRMPIPKIGPKQLSLERASEQLCCRDFYTGYLSLLQTSDDFCLYAQTKMPDVVSFKYLTISSHLRCWVEAGEAHQFQKQPAVVADSSLPA